MRDCSGRCNFFAARRSERHEEKGLLCHVAHPAAGSDCREVPKVHAILGASREAMSHFPSARVVLNLEVRPSAKELSP